MTHLSEFNRNAGLAGSCAICGSSAVMTDEVDASGMPGLLLAECGRCEHRWTRRLSMPARVQERVRRVAANSGRRREVATAA